MTEKLLNLFTICYVYLISPDSCAFLFIHSFIYFRRSIQDYTSIGYGKWL